MDWPLAAGRWPLVAGRRPQVLGFGTGAGCVLAEIARKLREARRKEAAACYFAE